MKPSTPEKKRPERTVRPSSTLDDVLRDQSLPKNRNGRPVTGLYPEVDRKKLSETLGIHITTVSAYLNGRSRMPFATAIKVAETLAVPIEQLNGDLLRQGEEYRTRCRKK